MKRESKYKEVGRLQQAFFLPFNSTVLKLPKHLWCFLIMFLLQSSLVGIEANLINQNARNQISFLREFYNSIFSIPAVLAAEDDAQAAREVLFKVDGHGTIFYGTDAAAVQNETSEKLEYLEGVEYSAADDIPGICALDVGERCMYYTVPAGAQLAFKVNAAFQHRIKRVVNYEKLVAGGETEFFFDESIQTDPTLIGKDKVSALFEVDNDSPAIYTAELIEGSLEPGTSSASTTVETLIVDEGKPWVQLVPPMEPQLYIIWRGKRAPIGKADVKISNKQAEKIDCPREFAGLHCWRASAKLTAAGTGNYDIALSAFDCHKNDADCPNTHWGKSTQPIIRFRVLGVGDRNRAPEAHSKTVKVYKNRAKSISLLGTDFDEDPLTVSVPDLRTEKGGKLTYLDGKATPTYEASMATITYMPKQDFLGNDSFAFLVSDRETGHIDEKTDAGIINIEVVEDLCEGEACYKPVIGIPDPDFGIEETIESVYGSSGSNRTYYVDNSKASCTANGLGSPSAPLCKIPSGLQAGSVVYIEGGPYTRETDGSKILLTGFGTPEAPIFYHGVGNPQLNNSVRVSGSYIVAEDFDVTGEDNMISVNIESGYSHTDHIAVRHNNIYDNPKEASFAAVSVNDSRYDSTVSHVVVYKNHAHNLGNWMALRQNDAMGTSVGVGAEHVWVLDNLYHELGGDGIIVNGPRQVEGVPVTPRYVYLGRNTAYVNFENGLDVKEVEHLVISQNDFFRFYRDPGPTDGSAIVIHYTSEGTSLDTWTLFNKIHDSNRGIKWAKLGGVHHGIGNLVFNIADGALIVDRVGGLPSDNYPGSTVKLYNNTVVGAGIGIVSIKEANDPEGFVELYNNVISGVGSDDRGLGHMIIEWNSDFLDSRHVSISNNLLDPFGTSDVRLRWGGGATHHGPVESYKFAGNFSGTIADDPEFLSLDPCLKQVDLSDPYVPDVSGSGYVAARNIAETCDHDPFFARIGAASPAIDASDPKIAEVLAAFEATFGLPLKTDHDGNPRPVDVAGVGGEGAVSSFDIGAFEFTDCGETCPEPPALYGDVDDNGLIQAQDALLALRAAVNSSSASLTDTQAKAADVDGIEGVSANDAELILRRAVGFLDPFPVEEV